jgi:hypothetical protein
LSAADLGEGSIMSDDTRYSIEDILTELRAREPIFHHPELGTTRADFEAQTAPDYWEVGASGRRYDREFIWATLERRYAKGAPDVWEADDFQCRQLGPDTYLLTYQLRQDTRLTLRATVWRWTGAGWQALYHQGTIVTP